MSVSANAMFRTVPKRDPLGFWGQDGLYPRKVTEFLNFDKRDVARVAKVAPSSVRFDQKMPADVLARLEEIANICGLVADYFDGDAAKTALWFRTKNPLLGEISPRDMIRFGRYERLRRFVMEALEQPLVLPTAASVMLERPAAG
jgi:hypothetical protein